MIEQFTRIVSLRKEARILMAEVEKNAGSWKTEKTELAAQLEASKEAQVEFDEKVSNAALARMQELGVSEPVATIADDETDDLYTQYTNLKATNPAAAGAFWLLGVKLFLLSLFL